jgi:hypothetical protein
LSPLQRSVSVDAGDADRELRRIATLLTDLRPFWPRVTRLFVGWMRLQFESEGAFWGVGTRWTPLAASTVARKRALGLRLQILQATGQAKQAASRPERIAGPTSLTLRIDDAGEHHGPVLQYHQEGGPRLPKRIVVGDGLPPLAAFELEREAEAHVSDFLGRF